MEVGLTGLTADQLQGPRAELYGRAGLGPQQPTQATLMAFHAMGVGGGVQPASAPVGDRALTKTPPELRFFSGKGAHGSRRSNKPHYVALGPQADGSFGVMVGGGVSDEISIDQRSTTRRLGLFAAMRVRWMLTLVDETHPAFLDLPYTAAALDYAMYIGVLELDHPTYAVEQFDSAVMFQLHLGAWRWTDPLPPALVHRLSELRQPRDQQCFCCGAFGHGMDTCPDVTGMPLPTASAGAGTKGATTAAGVKPLCYDFQKETGCARGAGCQYCHECQIQGCNSKDHGAAGHGK